LKTLEREYAKIYEDLGGVSEKEFLRDRDDAFEKRMATLTAIGSKIEHLQQLFRVSNLDKDESLDLAKSDGVNTNQLSDIYDRAFMERRSTSPSDETQPPAGPPNSTRRPMVQTEGSQCGTRPLTGEAAGTGARYNDITP
jgi:hypothetical protein